VPSVLIDLTKWDSDGHVQHVTTHAQHNTIRSDILSRNNGHTRESEAVVSPALGENLIKRQSVKAENETMWR
jgi:hypothetical protein